jgi:Thioredoxin-like domain/Thioredoxin
MVLLLFLQFGMISSTVCELPNFSAGNFNITSEKQFKDLVKKDELFLLALSAKWCTHCCQFEKILQDTTKELNQRNFTVARADISTQTYLSKNVDKNENLPHLYVIYKGKFKRYDYPMGPYVYTYIDKFRNPHQVLNTEAQIERFLMPSDDDLIIVIGFISDLSEDYLKFYKDAAIETVDWPSTKFGVVTDKALIKSLKNTGKYVKYLNSITVHAKNETKHLDLELDSKILDFIISSSIGAVEQLTTFTFQIYKTLEMPLLVLFIDEKVADHYNYITIFEKVARDHPDIKFVWMDGSTQTNIEKRKAVGLVNDILPAVAFNLYGEGIFPYDDTKPITVEGLNKFIHDYASNSLKPGPNKSRRVVNKELEEKFKDTALLYMNDFYSNAATEGYDVLLILYDPNDQNSTLIAPYYNKVAKRYKELKINSVKVYRIDRTLHPTEAIIGHYNLPAILFLPAFHKNRPYVQYTGEAKTVPLMFFVQKYADIKFELPELPHLTPDLIPAYWEQVSELDEEKRAQVAAANERRDWGDYF